VWTKMPGLKCLAWTAVPVPVYGSSLPAIKCSIESNFPQKYSRSCLYGQIGKTYRYTRFAPSKLNSGDRFAPVVGESSPTTLVITEFVNFSLALSVN